MVEHPIPADNHIQEAPRIIIEPSVSAPDGSFYVYDGQSGYRQVVEPWAVADHIATIKGTLALGDVEAWTAYVRRFVPAEHVGRALLVWSERGLKATIDYHTDLTTPGRAQWIAEHPFLLSDQWKAWTALANGETAWTQQQTVNKLDQLAEDIVEPVAGTVIDIVRKLRASVKLAADSELGQDGSQTVSFKKDSKVEAKVPIPSEIVIQIPVLKGHTTERDGKPVPVTYRLPVKVRPSIDDNSSTLTFRFFMPTAERVLEAVYADRVTAARALLGEAYPILRATAS